MYDRDEMSERNRERCKRERREKMVEHTREEGDACARKGCTMMGWRKKREREGGKRRKRKKW